MVDMILRLFASEEKVGIVLANPLIEFIFMILFLTFTIAVITHLLLYVRLKRIRSTVSGTKRMDIEPLRTFKENYERRQQEEAVKAETFVQEQFSSWRMFHLPVVSLMKMIQMTVSVFILLGVLGTFIGLTISLGSIDVSGTELVENVVGVLSGIDMAFYTSIAGMGLSLIMTILTRVFHTEYLLTDTMLQVESLLEGEEERGMGRLIDVSETINQSILNLQETNQKSLGTLETAFAGFQEYTTGLQQSAEDLAAFNTGLSENLIEFQDLFTAMKVVTDGFKDGTDKLNNHFDTLFTYFRKADQRNERTAHQVETVYEKVKETASSQMETLGTFGQTALELKDFINTTVNKQEAIRDSFGKGLQTSEMLVERLEEHNKAFKDTFGSDLRSTLHGIKLVLAELSKDFDQLGRPMAKLPEALEVIHQTQASQHHLLADRFEELKEFNRSFSNHLTSHTAEAADFERKMVEASRTYEQASIKNKELIQEMNSLLSTIDRTFQRRENDLESNVDFMKQTLTNYVSGLEGTLGDKLTHVLQTLTHSIDGTQNSMKTEFQALRRVSEEIQHNNTHTTQSILRELQQEIQTFNRLLQGVAQEATSRNTSVRLKHHEF